MPKHVDLVVVGAGIIGLATARQYLAEYPGASVLVLERESGLASHQTGRNSGVLHSGIYYAPGSMKAELAVAGRSSMVKFCAERGIDYEICGKARSGVFDYRYGDPKMVGLEFQYFWGDQ